MTDEKWRPIPGYPDYEASDRGRIRNVRLGKSLAGTLTKKGYKQVSVRGVNGRKTPYIHRLVAAAFFGPAPRGHVVNHLNGIKSDNRACNLEWTTPEGNSRHAAAHGLLRPVRFPGEKNPGAKLRESDVRRMRALYRQGLGLAALGKMFGVTARAVHLVVTRRTWKHVE